jgi:hypothetical protein
MEEWRQRPRDNQNPCLVVNSRRVGYADARPDVRPGRVMCV